MTRDELIAALREARSGSDELNQAIASVIGYQGMEYYEGIWPALTKRAVVPNWTRSVDVALTLLPDPPRYFKLQRDEDEFGHGWHACYRRMYFGHAATPALAICLARLEYDKTKEPT